MKKILPFISNDRFFPILLALLVIVSYGLFTPFMGYFMDDWYLAWFNHTFGASQFPLFFSLDRPLMGYYYTAIFNLLGNVEQPIVWQLFGLFARWLCSYALWGFLKTLWPNTRRQNIWVCLLATVFPGFNQQWIVILYSYFFICLAGLFFSMTLMLKALHDRKHFWLLYLPSVIIAAYCAFAPEFFAGLELMRIGVLWIEISHAEKRFWLRVKKTLQYWSAFLLVYAAFIIWRVFFFVSYNHLIAITNSPLVLLESVGVSIFQAIKNALVVAWALPFDLSNYPSSGIFSWGTLALCAAVFALIFLWRIHTAKSNPGLPSPSEPAWRSEAFLLGGFALIVAILPFWSAGLSIDVTYPLNRFMLAFIFGSSLTLVALVEILGSLIKRAMPVTLVLGILVAAATGYQFISGYHYKNVWQEETNLYWQIAWRMPGIAPGTAIMTYQLPNEDYIAGNAVAAQLNWTYSNGAPNRYIDYDFFILNTPQINALPTHADGSIAANQSFNLYFRTYLFEGNTNNTVLVSYELPGCLRVVDDNLTPLSGITYAQNQNVMFSAQHLSNLGLISEQNTVPIHLLTQIFGSEPAHTWCYYFEKAELSTQLGDYSSVVSLFKEATAEHFSPQVQTEYYPFITAYARTGDWQAAYDLTEKLDFKNNPILDQGLCHVWTSLSQEAQQDPTATGLVKDVIGNLNCAQ